MKTEKKILIAFLLNLFFALLELFGGIFTNSIAVLSDALHDFGDSFSIGLSFFLEKKSSKPANDTHTYGYRRYSVLGGLISTCILMIGSMIMITEAVKRIISPVEVNAQGMIILGIFGVVVNFVAAVITGKSESINQKSINLHMLEDVLTWSLVLIGAISMHFTKINYLDSVLSIGIAVFLLVAALKNLLQILDLFLEKTPKDVNISELMNNLSTIEGIENIHHFHIRSIDGYHHYATMHVVTKVHDMQKLKKKIRESLEKYHIVHAVIETENSPCENLVCKPAFEKIGESKCRGHHHPLWKGLSQSGL